MLPFYYRAEIDPRFNPENKLEDFDKLEFCVKVRTEKTNVLREWLSKQYPVIDAIDARREGRRHYVPRHEIEKYKAVRALYSKLKNCTEENPCDSRACAVCSRQHRIWAISCGTKLAKGRLLKFLTYCPCPEGITSVIGAEGLTKDLTENFYQYMRRNFPDEVMVIARLDVRVRKDGRLEPHFHALVIGVFGTALRDDLKPQLRPGQRAKRGRGAPWVVEDVYPSDCWKVMSYVVRQRPKPYEIGDTEATQRYKDLTVHLEIERLLFLDSVSFRDAMVYFHCRHKNGLSIEPSIPRPSAIQLLVEKACMAADLRRREAKKHERAKRADRNVFHRAAYKRAEAAALMSLSRRHPVDDDLLELEE